MQENALIWILTAYLTAASLAGCDDAPTDGDGDADADGDADGDSDADGDGDADGDADGDGDRPAPTWPDDDAPGFAISVSARWLMIGDGLTPPDDTWSATVTTPAGVEALDLWIDDVGPRRFEATSDEVAVTLDVSDLGPGEHEVVIAAADDNVAALGRRFFRTHALYVILAADWDDPDNREDYLDNLDELRANHPGLRYTHYFGPYTFTAPTVTDERRRELADYVIEGRDTFGDELGLHIHPYCSFVEHAGLTCRTEPAFGLDDVDPTGYTVVFSAYTTEEQVTLLEAASELFVEWGLGEPTSFRAGGWTGDESTLAALVEAGFTVQADSVLASATEEWEGYLLYDWLMEHWGEVTTTSQPYWPDPDDIAHPPADPADAAPVLQVPANAIMVDYMGALELRAAFEDNWSGGALDAPTVYHSGVHPTNFGAGYRNTIDGALLYTADEAMYDEDAGPVIYATAGEMLSVFPM